MLGSALYFPHVDIADSRWLRSAVLFWDELKTIAPSSIKVPYKSKDTRILWKEGFLEPLRCDLHPDILDTLCKRVVGLMDDELFDHHSRLERDPNAMALMHASKFGDVVFEKFRLAGIHPGKLSPELRSIALRSGLARLHPRKMSPEMRHILEDRQFSSTQPKKFFHQLSAELRRSGSSARDDDEWLLVDTQFASIYMSALAALLAREADLAALTDEEPALGVNLHTLLDDVKPSSVGDKKGALVSFIMKSIKVDPDVRIDKLLTFRNSRHAQFAELSAQFEDLSSKIGSCETGRELQSKARDVYVARILPKLEALKDELHDSAIQCAWDGIQRAVTISVPAGGAMAYFTGLTGTTLLAAGAALAITDIGVKAHLARKKTRRASPFTYLLDVNRKFSGPRQ